MWKKVLAAIGALFLLGIVVAVIGGYYVYKKSSDAVTEAMSTAVENFIQQQKPGEEVSTTLRSLTNSMRIRKGMMERLFITTTFSALADEKISDEELAMLKEAATIAEGADKIDKEVYADFVKKHENVIGNAAKETATPTPTP